MPTLSFSDLRAQGRSSSHERPKTPGSGPPSRTASPRSRPTTPNNFGGTGVPLGSGRPPAPRIGPMQSTMPPAIDFGPLTASLLPRPPTPPSSQSTSQQNRDGGGNTPLRGRRVSPQRRDAGTQFESTDASSATGNIHTRMSPNGAARHKSSSPLRTNTRGQIQPLEAQRPGRTSIPPMELPAGAYQGLTEASQHARDQWASKSHRSQSPPK
jgi:hypothetical protein